MIGEKTKLLWQNPEYRQHMIEIHKGKKFSEEHKKKIGIKSKGRHWKLSEETKRKISEICKGRKHTIETRKKMSIAHKGKHSGGKSNFWKGGISKNIVQYQREYYYRKPNKKLLNQKRIFILRGGGDLTIQTIQQVYENNIRQYGTLTCYLCLKPIEFRQDCLEHKIPLSRGGTNVKENLAIAHKGCNSKKNNKTYEEYKREAINA